MPYNHCELELELYRVLSHERFRVHTYAELCDGLRTDQPRLEACAAGLTRNIRSATGLRLVHHIPGIGYMLELGPAALIDYIRRAIRRPHAGHSPGHSPTVSRHAARSRTADPRIVSDLPTRRTMRRRDLSC